MTVPQPEHVPVPVAWTCRACGPATEWPCAPARAGLQAEHRIAPTAIAVLMAGRWSEASADLNVPPESIYERFLGWLRRRPATGTEPGA